MIAGGRADIAMCEGILQQALCNTLHKHIINI